MRTGLLLAGAGAIALSLAAPAEAAITTTTVNQLLTATPYTFSVGGGAASFSITGDFKQFAPSADVSTSGTGAVSTIFGGVADFGAGAVIGTGGLYSFQAYPAATLIPNSQADDFIGLSYALGLNTYFGFAEVNGASLLGYAFDSVAGEAITTANVPEPATLALLLTGIGAIGALRRRV